jgi:hypothetical protein
MRDMRDEFGTFLAVAGVLAIIAIHAAVLVVSGVKVLVEP